MSNFWFARVINALGQLWRIDLVESSVYSDGAHVELSAEGQSSGKPEGWRATARVDGDSVVAIELCEPLAAKTPGLWFAGWTADSALDSLPPAAELMAFTGHNQRPGSLIDLRELATRDIDLAEQVGAVRSFPITGEVDQLYVHPKLATSRGRHRSRLLAGARERGTGLAAIVERWGADRTW